MDHPQDMTTAQAAQWLAAADAPTVIDVRTPAEFAGAHIEGAVNVPLDLLEEEPAAIAEQLTGEVLLVCQTANRARTALDLLAPHLGGRAHVLDCGMAQWQQDRLPTTGSGRRVWAMDRQVRTVAGGIVLTSILASLKAPQARFVAGGIGAGLVYSGLSGSCAMAGLLAKMPWNRGHKPVCLVSVSRELESTRV